MAKHTVGLLVNTSDPKENVKQDRLKLINVFFCEIQTINCASTAD